MADTPGLVGGPLATPASVRDWDGGREAVPRARLAAPGLARVDADSAHRACAVWAVGFARGVRCVAGRPARG